MNPEVVLKKTHAVRAFALTIIAGATLTVAAPAAFAASDPQACPTGSHGVVLSDPRDPSGPPLYVCVKPV
jgi:hypothetical protein